MKSAILLLLMTGVAGASPVLMDGPATARRSPADLMNTAVERMRDSAQRLTGQDPGMETQELQWQAIHALDALIAMQPKPRDNDAQNPGPPGNHPTTANPPQPGATGDASSPSATTPGTAGVASEVQKLEDLIGYGDMWLFLGKGSRPDVTNTVPGGSLKSYSAKVRNYYETLAEMDRGARKR